MYINKHMEYKINYKKFWAIILIAIVAFVVMTVSWDRKEAPAYEPIIRSIVQTTNSTPSNVFTLAVATGQTVRITVDVLGKSGNNRLRGIKTATIKNISGTLTVTGATVSDIAAIVADAALVTAGWTITTSGTNVIIQVTGVAATTIDWVSNSWYYTD